MVRCGATYSEPLVFVITEAYSEPLAYVITEAYSEPLGYVISEAYSKPCQISKTVRHIENSGIVRTVYSNIFRNIQGHSAIFCHDQAY